MPPVNRRLLVEWLILAGLVTYGTIGGATRNPERLLRWIFGALPSLPHAALRPWTALQLGLSNVLLCAALVSIFSSSRWAERARWAVAGWFAIVLVCVPVLRDVEIRLHVDEAPGNHETFRSQSHDGGVVQTALAGAMLRRGENPYSADFGGTAMARTADSDEAGWRSIGYARNPALAHVPYLPAVLYLAALPLPDPRLLYLLCAFVFAILIARRFTDGPARRSAFLLSLCNPLLLPYLVVGRNEILLLVPLVLFCDFVHEERWHAAAWALGAALSLKQFAIAVVPFFVIAAIARRRSWRALWPMVALPLLTCLPFLLWDARAFLEDTIFWSLGAGADAYPVKWTGWGLPVLGYGLGLVDTPAGANPFGWLALPAELAALALLGRRVWRDPRALVLASGVFLFVMLFVARAFAFNYLAVPALLVAMAALPPRREPNPV